MTTVDYTEEMLNQVEQYASIYLKISDIAVLFDIPAEQLREDIADRSTEVSKRYHKGKAASKVKLLHQTYDRKDLPKVKKIKMILRYMPLSYYPKALVKLCLQNRSSS